jgi:hypothetical protein
MLKHLQWKLKREEARSSIVAQQLRGMRGAGTVRAKFLMSCVCVRMFVACSECVLVRIAAHICVYVCMYMYVCIHVLTSAARCVRMYVCACTPKFTRTHLDFRYVPHAHIHGAQRACEKI